MFQFTRAFTRRVKCHNERQLVQRADRSRQSRYVTAEGPGSSSLSGLAGRSNNCSKRLTVLAWVFILSIAYLAAPTTTRAQVLYGSLTGNVTDPAGAAVAGASVSVVNLGTNVSKETTTNDEGIYQFNDLIAGSYKVTITAPNFSTVVSEGVNIEVNNVRRLDVGLQPGGVTDTVTISADAEVELQTDRADVNVTQTARQVNNLPLAGSAGRNYQSLMQIVPGAVLAGEQNSAAGSPQRSISFNVNGVSRLQNNTKIDGSSITYPWLPTNTAYVPPAEAIQTVNVVTNAFDAEQGLAGGAAINVIIKSGTNDFHGVGWVYHTNHRLTARNHFQTTPQNPKDLLTQFGYAVGGPIIKNKLFFFTDFERTTRRNLSRDNRVSLAPASLRPDAQGNVRFPTAAEGGATIFDPLSNANPALRTPFPNNTIPANRIDLAARELIGRLPEPNLPGFVNNFLTNGTASFNRNNMDTKINYNPTEKFTLFGRYSFSPTLITEPPLLGEAGGDAINGGQLGEATGACTGGRDGHHLHVRPDALRGRQRRLHAPAAGRRRPRRCLRHELRPRRAANPRHQRPRPATGRHPLLQRHQLGQHGELEHRQPVHLPRQPVRRLLELLLAEGRALVPLRRRLSGSAAQPLPAAGRHLPDRARHVPVQRRHHGASGRRRVQQVQ